MRSNNREPWKWVVVAALLVSLSAKSSVAATAGLAANEAQRAEQMRAACIAGRRYVCGKVLQVLPEGVVVDSGYSSLLQPPFNRSWVVPGTVSVSRDPAAVEAKTPDAMCIGEVFLSSLPKRPVVKAYDYVVIHGYPAGEYSYAPVPGVHKKVRRFSASLDAAVKIRLQAADIYGLASRPSAKPYLLMPDRITGPLPSLLSQTGAFKDTRALVPSDSLIPYSLNFSFWSDGAAKSRWVSVPNEAGAAATQIGFAPTGEWTFPNGTVLVKHFEIATNEMHPELRRRLETRFIVRNAAGSVYGVTYKWRADNTDAELLTNNVIETLSITTASGVRTQKWTYPSRQDCRTCHTDNAGGVLGVKTRQLNCEFTYPDGTTDNQLRAWNHIGLFTTNLDEAELSRCASLARPNDLSRSLEDRARSYLDANCTHCHRPGGTVASLDTRYDTPLAQQSLIGGPVLIDEGIDDASVIAPNDLWRSLAYMRVSTLEALKMPPLAHEQLDADGVALLGQWIQSLPGPRVLPPPTMSPTGGRYPGPIEIALAHSEPGAAIHYTTDGSVPTSADPVYDRPLKLDGPTILRAKAFKHGCTKSITVQQVFVIGE